MNQVVRAGAGGLLTVAGIIWTLQGLGYVQHSFMSGDTTWAIVGPVVALLGIVIMGTALRGRWRKR